MKNLNFRDYGVCFRCGFHYRIHTRLGGVVTDGGRTTPAEEKQKYWLEELNKAVAYQKRLEMERLNNTLEKCAKRYAEENSAGLDYIGECAVESAYIAGAKDALAGKLHSSNGEMLKGDNT